MEGASTAAAPATGGDGSSAAAPQAGEATTTEGQSSGKGTQAKAKAAPQTAEELEEIAIGSVKGKLPKELAKVVKDLERGFHSKAQEKAQLERQFRAEIQRFKENPDAFFQAVGMDPEEFAESRLARRLEQMQMSPEQRELAELKAWKAEQEKLKAEQEAKEKETREQAEMRQVMEQTDMEVAEAWKDSGLPNDIFFVKQIAAIMRESAILTQNGTMERPLTAKQAASIVKERLFKQLAPVVRQLGPEGILKFLGDDAWKTVREWDVARATSSAAKTSPGTSSPGQQKPASDKPGQNKPLVLKDSAFREAFKKSMGA